MANPMLLWFVGYSNLTSIVIVTFCFLAMTIFIGFISMNGDYSGRSNIHIGIEQRNMVKMSNPFFLQLECHGRKLEDGLHLHLSSLLPSNIFVIWGAKIHPFHDFILKPGRWIQKTFAFNKVENFRELDILHCDELQFPEAGDHSISLHCPDSVSSASLGDMPRKRYPVAVLTFIRDNSASCKNVSSQNEQNRCSDDSLYESDSESDNKHFIIGLISIVHLQDEKVTQNSHIISQYVKTSGVPLYSLQPLYLSSDSCQSQQNHQNVGSAAAPHLNKNKKSSSEEILPEELESSSIVGSNDCNGVSGTNSGNEFSDRCLSCDCSLVVKSDSLLLNHDSHSFIFDGITAGICDNCHTASRPQTEEKYIRPVEEQHGDSENEAEVVSTLSDEITCADNNLDPLDCQTDIHAECVVCQTHQVRCALLPCRHACVCLGCFKLLYRCPLCRAGIESYFLLKNNLSTGDGNTDDEDDGCNENGEDEMIQNLQHQAVNVRFYQMWQRFNTRLNHILGFR